MRLVLAAAAFLALAGSAAAQTWPSRPIMIVAPSTPGSAPDVIARIVAQQLAAELGAHVVVENRAGAGGNIGAQAVARAQPDGHTFGVSLPGPMVINPMLMDTGYQPKTELMPITMLATQASVLVVSSTVPGTTLKEVMDWIRARPGQVNYAISGIGSVSHLGMELIRLRGGLDMVQVGYKGSPDAVMSIAGGDTQIAALPPVAVMPLAEAGKLRMLAVTSRARSPHLPHLPTFHEAGMEGFEALAWMGLVAPAKTPRPIAERVSAAVRKAFAKPDVQDTLLKLQFDPAAGTIEAFADYLQEEETRWRPIVQQAGLVTK